MQSLNSKPTTTQDSRSGQPEGRRYFTFGKYKDCSVEGVIVSNPSYAIWAHWNVSFFKLTNEELHRAESNMAASRACSRQSSRRRRYWTIDPDGFDDYDVDGSFYQDFM